MNEEPSLPCDQVSLPEPALGPLPHLSLKEAEDSSCVWTCRPPSSTQELLSGPADTAEHEMGGTQEPFGPRVMLGRVDPPSWKV